MRKHWKASGLIYAVQEEGSPYVKIGSTRQSIQGRLQGLQRKYACQLQIMATVPVASDVLSIEAIVHDLLASYHVYGEWFALDVDQEILQTLVTEAIQWLVNVTGENIWI